MRKENSCEFFEVYKNKFSLPQYYSCESMYLQTWMTKSWQGMSYLSNLICPNVIIHIFAFYRIAIAQLTAEGEKFKRRHELRYRLEESPRLKPNLRYFKNALKHCVSSNDKREKIRKSKAAEELKCLEKQVEASKANERNAKATNYKKGKRYEKSSPGTDQDGVIECDSNYAKKYLKQDKSGKMRNTDKWMLWLIFQVI